MTAVYLKQLIAFLFSFSLLASLAQLKPSYNFKKPTDVYQLPDTLREISGITFLDSNNIACVQDENGIIFTYDLASRRISDYSQFHINGDYEGIARIGNVLYVLRSDGNLYEIKNFSSKPDLNIYNTGVPANNNEGICYDEKNKRLLIACKNKPGKGKELKNLRVIYAFDPVSKKLSQNPVITININEVRALIKQNNIQLPARIKKNGKKDNILRFKTSAIAIHPGSGQLYLISAADYLMFIFSNQGKLSEIIQLDQTLFNKAEGITFLPNGDLLISNEGQDSHARILFFKAN